MPSNDKISLMSAAVASDIAGSAGRMEMTKAYATVPVTLGLDFATLRTSMFAGGTGYTATDPLVAGAASFTTGEFDGIVTIPVSNIGATTGSWIDFGGQAKLFSPAADAVSTLGFFESERAASTDLAFVGWVLGDAYSWFFLRASGAMEWGPGNVTRDVTLARSGVGELTLTGKLTTTSYATIDGIKITKAGADVTNVAIGTLYGTITGVGNTYLGDHAAYSATSGGGNVAIGYYALSPITTGVNNTAVGSNAFQANNSQANGLALGAFAGAYETAGNSFYVNTLNRTNLAGDKAGSLLYGTFHATPASQTLTINAGTITTIGSLAITGALTGVTTLAASGRVNIGGAMTQTGYKLIVENDGAADNSLALYDLQTAAANVGGVLVFGGYKTTTTTRANFGLIQGGLEGASGTAAGFLKFSVANAGGTLTEAFRLSSTLAGTFAGALAITGALTGVTYIEGTEMAAPAAGAANTGRIFFQDNGAGKTQLMCIFASGAAQQLAIQP